MGRGRGRKPVERALVRKQIMCPVQPQEGSRYEIRRYCGGPGAGGDRGIKSRSRFRAVRPEVLSLPFCSCSSPTGMCSLGRNSAADTLPQGAQALGPDGVCTLSPGPARAFHGVTVSPLSHSPLLKQQSTGTWQNLTFRRSQ